jgi:hypothetical protein
MALHDAFDDVFGSRSLDLVHLLLLVINYAAIIPNLGFLGNQNLGAVSH